MAGETEERRDMTLRGSDLGKEKVRGREAASVSVFTEPNGSNFLLNVGNSLPEYTVSHTCKKYICLNHCDFLANCDCAVQ
jgi:hypothetical protein